MTTDTTGITADPSDLGSYDTGGPALDGAPGAAGSPVPDRPGAGTDVPPQVPAPARARRYPAYPDRRMQRPEPKVTQQRSLSRWLAGAHASDEFFAAAKWVGAGAQAAVLGALAQAVRESTDAERMRVILPVHTRTDPADAAAVGWYVGLSPIDVELDTSCLETLMLRAQQATTDTRELAPQATRAAQLLGVAPGAPFVASYVDMRRLPSAERWRAWRARTLRSRTYSNTDFYLWILRTVDGLNVSTRYPDSPEAIAAASEVLDALERAVLQAPDVLRGKPVLTGSAH